jgi:glycine/D-amino acid oxidase-like deaminating enzyme
MSNPDVLVIGAGFTGAMIAANLAEHGAQVSVIDALHVAGGATRRALGLATPSLNPAHVKETAQGVQRLTHLATQHGVLPQAGRVLHVASTAARADALRLNGLSLPGTQFKWETSPSLVPSGFGGGLSVDGSAVLDIGMLTTKLLQHRGITVHTGIEVSQLEFHEGRMMALAAGYTIRANSVVLATNAYCGLLSPYLADSVQFARGVLWTSRMIEVNPAGEDDDADDVVPIQMPLLVDNGKLTVVPGTDGRVRLAAWQWDEPLTSDPTDDVQQFLSQHMPHLAQHTELWQNSVTTMTRDGAPLVGKLDGEGRVFYAVGLGLYGLAWGPIVAERVAGLVMSAD